MLAFYIISPIVILITLLIIRKVRKNKRKYAEWLLELNQWEPNDVIEIRYDTYDDYFDVEDNKKYTAAAYVKYAKDCHQKKYPNTDPKAYARLVKWNETDAYLEYMDGSNSYISTNFILKNLSFIKRTKEKGMDTFILSKKEKIQRLRNKKLIRILKETENE
jgi:hypothetical protein